MAVPVVEDFEVSIPGSAVASHSAVTPSGVTAGELLVVILVNEDATNSTTFDAVTGWTKQFEFGDARTDVKLAMYWREADGTSADDFSVTLSTGGDWTISWFLRVSGVDMTSGPFGNFGAQVERLGNFGLINVTGLTTSAADSLVVAAFGFDGADVTFNGPSGTGWPTTFATDQSAAIAGGNSDEVSGGFTTKGIASTSTASETVQFSTASGPDDQWVGTQFEILAAAADPDTDADAGVASATGTGHNASAIGDGRVTANLVYEALFDEGSGLTVGDEVGSLDSTIQDFDSGNSFSWATGYLDITDDDRVLSDSAATSLVNSIIASDEFTAELWVTPADDTALLGTGPAGIMGISQGAAVNFLIAQSTDTDEYIVYLRRGSGTTTDDNNGLPTAETTGGRLTTSLQHVVFTYSDTNGGVLYVDGVSRATMPSGAGDLNRWDNSWSLAYANRVASARPFAGSFHRAAIYDAELSSSDVAQNFAAGAEAGADPDTDADAGVASATGTGNNPGGSVGASGGQAPAVGSAGAPAVAVGASGGQAAGVGAGQGVSGSVDGSGGAAAASGTGHDATISTEAATAASAGVASGAGSGLGPSGSVSTVSGVALATGSGQAAVSSVATSAVAASSSGSGGQPGGTVSTPSGAAAGSGTGHDATTLAIVDGSASPTVAPGTGTAENAGVDVATSAVAAAGSGTGHDATASALVETDAPAGLATSTGTASTVSSAVSASAGVASGTGSGVDATASTSSNATASAGLAASVGSAAGVAGVVAVSPPVATGSSVGHDLSGNVDASAVTAAGTGSAGEGGGQGGASASVAAGAGSGLEASGADSAPINVAPASGTGHNATIEVQSVGLAAAQVASGTGAGVGPTVDLAAVALRAIGFGVAYAPDGERIVPAVGGGWGTLNEVYREIAERRQAERARDPEFCPHDDTRLERDVDGRLVCPWDGWRPTGSRV